MVERKPDVWEKQLMEVTELPMAAVEEERFHSLSPMLRAVTSSPQEAMFVCLPFKLLCVERLCGNTQPNTDMTMQPHRSSPAALCVHWTGEAGGPHGAPQVRAWEWRGGCPLWPPAVALLEKLPRFGFKKGQNQLNKCMAFWCSVYMQLRLIVQLQCKE